MPVLEAVRTFAGITNENEFYSHHYLAEVFRGDIKVRMDAWEAADTARDLADERPRASHRRLQGLAQRWFALRSQIARAGEQHERWRLFVELQRGLLQALGHPTPTSEPINRELIASLPLPFWDLHLPQLAIIPSYQPRAEDEDVLNHRLLPLHYCGLPVPQAVQEETWADLLSDAVFGAVTPPR